MKARWINNRGGGRTSAPARDAAALHCKTLRALPVILGNCVIIGGIVLAILTARDNIFSPVLGQTPPAHGWKGGTEALTLPAVW
ncbi:MAG: hypothetical protein WB384_08910 [Candidatus Sulfotelmatobacter sp.]